MLDLTNKKVVITGGGSGIGKAIAMLFADRGAEIHVIDINANALQEAVDRIARDKKKAFGHCIDITDQQQVLALFRSLGSINILVNNAGIAHIGNVENTSESDFDEVFKVNVKGAYNCLYAAIPIMKTAGGGVIVNMASIASSVGIVDRFAYSMSKGAIFSMTLAVARDYIGDNIRCNSISPARVHTPFVDGFIAKNYKGQETDTFERLSRSQPIGRMGKPEEIAALALFLCSNEAAFITGCDYPIDGGFIKLNN